jgi:hypothetical protein
MGFSWSPICILIILKTLLYNNQCFGMALLSDMLSGMLRWYQSIFFFHYILWRLWFLWGIKLPLDHRSKFICLHHMLSIEKPLTLQIICLCLKSLFKVKVLERILLIHVNWCFLSGLYSALSSLAGMESYSTTRKNKDELKGRLAADDRSSPPKGWIKRQIEAHRSNLR